MPEQMMTPEECLAVDLAALKASLGIDDDADDETLKTKLQVAQTWVESYTGNYSFKFYRYVDQPDPHPVMREAVRHVAEHLFEGGEPTFKSGATSPLPVIVRDLLRPYRAWNF